MAFRLGLIQPFHSVTTNLVSLLLFGSASGMVGLKPRVDLPFHPGMAGSSNWGHGVQCSHPEERRVSEKVLVSAFSKRSYFGHVSVPGARKTQYTDWLSLGHPMHISRWGWSQFPQGYRIPRKERGR